MKRSTMIGAAVVSVLVALAGCDDKTGPDDDAEVFTASLTGAAERPTPVTTNATGTAKVTINSNRTLSVDLTVTGITPTVQHIHGPATEQEAASPIVNLGIGLNQVIAAAAFTGAVSYDSALVLIRNGRAYVNVHSATNPGGEIRGQLRGQ